MIKTLIFPETKNNKYLRASHVSSSPTLTGFFCDAGIAAFLAARGTETDDVTEIKNDMTILASKRKT
jgi:hypothetical protein